MSPLWRGAATILAAGIASFVTVSCSSDRVTSPPQLERPVYGIAGIPSSEAEMRARLDRVTRHVAVALSDARVRAYVYQLLHASPYREHKLHFDSFAFRVGSPFSSALASAAALTPIGLRAQLDSLIDLEFYMPVKEHWARWTGGSDLLVAWAIRDHETPVAYDLRGSRVALTSAEEPPATPTLGIVPRETDLSQPTGSAAPAGRDCGPAIQLEGLFYPLRRPRVAPYVLAGIGHFAVSPAPGSSRSPFGGRATAFGVGLHGRVRREWGLRVEGLVRIDARALDDELRGFLTYAPVVHPTASDVPAPHVTTAAYWIAPLAGPWRFVEPGYALKFATPFSPQSAASLTMALVHWRIPYSFDTRAVLIMPGYRWRGIDRGGHFYVQGGPLASVMVEGPDDGTRGGLHLEVGGRLGAGGVSATGGLGWIWLSRKPDPFFTADTGTDQHGLLAHIGITF